MSDKHCWCLICNQSMLMTHQEKCLFCRAPLSYQEITMDDEDIPEDIPKIIPTLRRQNAEYF